MTDKKTAPFVIGIRREDKNRWERRAPILPQHVAELAKNGTTVIVQPSPLRIFPDAKYAEAGAIVKEDLSECDLILGVKEVPIPFLLENKTYMFFSHTIKAQAYNMPLLDEILKKNIRLIDYEKITDESNVRLVRFGLFAGYAGMVDMIHSLGNRLLALGHSTPFLHVGYSYMYSSLQGAKDAVSSCAMDIAESGLHPDLGPLIFTFISSGTSSQGAQEILKLLPVKWIKPEEVETVAKSKTWDTKSVYATVLESKDYIEPIDPKAKFDKADYYKNPENYRSTFLKKYAPYVSVIINCAYWEQRFPRHITISQLKKLADAKNLRLLAVADISCDVHGAFEFLVKTTSIDAPLFVWDPHTRQAYESTNDKDYMYRNGILMLAVDNLPTEFPMEASHYFGDALLPYLKQTASVGLETSYEEALKQYPAPIGKAVMTNKGVMTPPFEYINELRKTTEKALRRILVLGAGLVSKPCIEYLARNHDQQITVADVSQEISAKVVNQVLRGKKASHITPVGINVTNEKELEAAVMSHDIVVSLLPRQFNPLVAKQCIKHKRHFVNSSYVSPELLEMQKEAEEAGILILCECGLDPGIDHISSLDMINKLKLRGGSIESFVSWCGALPAPETSNNPLGYKFSWSPKGVLMASIADATYMLNNTQVNIKGSQLWKNTQEIKLFPGLALEGVPNRDSIKYAEQYDIADTVQTIFRGTLRYVGFAEVMGALVDIGLVDDITKYDALDASSDKVITWNEFVHLVVDKANKQPHKTSKELVRSLLKPPIGFPSKGYHSEKLARVLAALEWIGLFSNSPVVHRSTGMEALTALLEEKLQFDATKDWDAVYMHHIVTARMPDHTVERHDMTFSVYGERNGSSAISRTVGCTVAMATELLLSGTVTTRGVSGPVKADIYHPMMEALMDEGFSFIHRVEVQDE